VVSRLKQFLYIGLTAFSFTVNAADDWHLGVGTSLLTIPLSDANIQALGSDNDTPTIFFSYGATRFEEDQDVNTASVDFYILNSKLPKWTFLTSIVPVTDTIVPRFFASESGSGTLSVSSPYTMTNIGGGIEEILNNDEAEMNMTMLEIGAAYDLFHTDNGWFLDVAFKAGFVLSGDGIAEVFNGTVTNVDGSTNTSTQTINVRSSFNSGYQRIELGAGKTIGNLVLRFAIVNISVNEAAGLEVTFDGIDAGLTQYNDNGEDSYQALQASVSYWW